MKMELKRLTLAAAAVLLLDALQPAAWSAQNRHSKGKMIEEGLASLDKRDYPAAVASFSKATRLDPKNSGAFFLLGHAHYQKGFMSGNPETADKSEAIAAINAYLQAATLDPELKAVKEPFRLYHGLGLCYEALGSHEKSIENYKKAFALAPTNAVLPLYAARARLRQNDLSKAFSNFSLGLKVAEKQNQKQALLKLVKSDPYLSALLKDAAVASAAAGRGLLAAAPASSMEGLRDSLRDTPAEKPSAKPREIFQDPEVIKQLGSAGEEFRFGRHKAAIDAYNQVLRLNRRTGSLNITQLSMIYENMGSSYRALGMNEPALASLRYSLEEMPLNSSAQYKLALIYASSGQNRESLRALSLALESAPSKGELRKIVLLARTDSELDGLRDLPGFPLVLEPFAERLKANAQP